MTADRALVRPGAARGATAAAAWRPALADAGR